MNDYIFLHIKSSYILGKVSKKKKVWNFPYFSGVGGFEKVIFHKTSTLGTWCPIVFNVLRCMNND